MVPITNHCFNTVSKCFYPHFLKHLLYCALTDKDRIIYTISSFIWNGDWRFGTGQGSCSEGWLEVEEMKGRGGQLQSSKWGINRDLCEVLRTENVHTWNKQKWHVSTLFLFVWGFRTRALLMMRSCCLLFFCLMAAGWTISATNCLSWSASL